MCAQLSYPGVRGRMMVAAGGGTLSMVLRWNTRERQSFWRMLLGTRAFAMSARTQDGHSPRRDDGVADDLNLGNAETRSAMPGPSGGQDAAFDAFFAQHEHALYGYLRRMLPSHDAALDVAQEAFFRAWQRFDTIRNYDRPQAWLFRVATNLALDTLRRGRINSVIRLFGSHDTDASDDLNADDTLAALIDPADMERSLAERDLVNQVLARLPERQRAALLLWAAHRLTCAEIAEAFETTEVNVRQLISRGRSRFRQIYDHERESG